MLKIRSNEKELMDDLQSEGEVIVQTLKELDVINRWLGGNYVSIRGVEDILSRESHQSQSLSVVDMGCGGGDILILMARWARKKGLKINLTGIDANSSIVEYAQQHCRDYPEVGFDVVNIFDSDFQAKQFDIVHCSLFTHHFTDEELTDLFSQFSRQAKKGIVINDLHRHPIAYYSIKMLTRIFSRSEMVRNDAAVSVARGFKRGELKELLEKAGITRYKISWNWAFRWKVVCWPPNDKADAGSI